MYEREAKTIAAKKLGMLLAGLVILMASVVMPAGATEVQGKAQFVGKEGEIILALKIDTPKGRYFINLLGGSDGPVVIPVESSITGAIQVGARLQGEDMVRVVLHSVVDDMTIQPIGAYELALPDDMDFVHNNWANWFQGVPLKENPPKLASQQGTQIDLDDLKALELDGWSMVVTTFPQFLKSDCGCCYCGALSCCPRTGECLQCGGCGTCCCIIDEPPGGPENPM
ncbi:MAG: hypothetical protein GY835_19245 [bacterium]|nr:hypothetical protein [bacterium]